MIGDKSVKEREDREERGEETERDREKRERKRQRQRRDRRRWILQMIVEEKVGQIFIGRLRQFMWLW